MNDHAEENLHADRKWEAMNFVGVHGLIDIIHG